MKIGVLYPRSTAHPGLMMDFMDGLKLLLKKEQLTNELQLCSESIAFGGNEKEVYEKAEKLLVLEDVSVLVAYVDLRVLEILKPLMYASGKLMIVVNPGANYPLNWVPMGNVINLSLQHGFSCWLSGKLAAATKEPGAVMATSFYDCGYLHSAAIVKSFVQEGGAIMYNYVNNQRYDDSFEISQLTDFLSTDPGTSILLCVFDSLPASLLYARLNNFENVGKLQLFVSPMMLEKQAIEVAAKNFKGSVKGYVPWQASLQNNCNLTFTDYYVNQTKREASIFSLLGWETGLVLERVFRLAENDYSDGSSLAGKIAADNIDSPRGLLKLDTATNYFISPLYECRLVDGAVVIQATVGDLEKEWADFVAYPSDAVSSGWTNTYLCY